MILNKFKRLCWRPLGPSTRLNGSNGFYPGMYCKDKFVIERRSERFKPEMHATQIWDLGMRFIICDD